MEAEWFRRHKNEIRAFLFFFAVDYGASGKVESVDEHDHAGGQQKNLKITGKFLHDI